MMVQKRGAERGAGSFDRSLNFSGYPQNEKKSQNIKDSGLPLHLHGSLHDQKRGAERGADFQNIGWTS